MQRLEAPVFGRNLKLIYGFTQLRPMEESGLGMKTLRELRSAGYPTPKYSFGKSYLTLTIFRSAEAAAEDALKGLPALGRREREDWVFISSKGSVTSSEYAKAIGVNAATAWRHLQRFVGLGLVSAEGGGHTTRYVVVRS